MFGNLNLKGRLLLGYTLPFLLFVVLSGLVYTNIRKVFDTFKNVERVQVLLLDIHTLEKNALGVIQSCRGYLGLRNPLFLEEYEDYLKQFNSMANTVEELTLYPPQKKRISQLRELVSQYDRISRPALELAQQGKYEEAASLINNQNGTQYVRQIEQLILEISVQEEELLNQGTEETLNSLSWLNYALLFGTLLVIILAISIATLIATNISQTIQQATQVMASSSTEIAAALEEQERTANQQASAVNETTTTMNELSTSSKSTAEQAESSVMDAKQALNLTENGSKAVEKTLDGMADLREKVDAIAQQIIRLSEQTNQIGNISKLVSDLANQTNMLALNAAVEAVRAGEHGKGFAVVAAEIRKLSDESQKSAQRINTLVTDIQSAINSTVIVTEEGTKTVLSGVEIAQMTALALMGVSDSVNNVVLNNQQISLNTQQQAIAISQVLEAMNSINQGSNETANGLNQTKTGLQRLNQVALELQSTL
ncbi:methyl-accepting chemotaxis protein [Lyngbya sp. PCC 8106]|uniref:methyl-accepting chemotaxis protein n=1 Tax=Lyngbya sp. (strain PCC 8106) TaxID=313612 RepID=UPI0000EAC730|nr:methyl-accepting chemotaxis protein [Lyngbya sp. PCC 8106]EAW38781.1 chemotaxis sensory transducer [Lyngbya sp. PCC 8106]